MDDSNVLMNFNTSLNSESSLYDCEKFCTSDERCWGCAIQCHNNDTCHVKAIRECSDTQNMEESANTSFRQKPGFIT